MGAAAEAAHWERLAPEQYATNPVLFVSVRRAEKTRQRAIGIFLQF
jgi:hypothetical protein